MKKEDKITVIEMQKFFNKHNTGLRLGKREFDAINEIIAVSQFPVQEQSKQEVSDKQHGNLKSMIDLIRSELPKGSLGYNVSYKIKHFIDTQFSLPQEQKDKVTGVSFAFIIYDKDEDQYTVYHDGDGGPVISAKTINEAREKYKEAFGLSDAVRKLLNFSSKAVEQKEPVCNTCGKKDNEFCSNSFHIIQEAEHKQGVKTNEVLHLDWIYNRLLAVHGENSNYDYMIKFKSIINDLSLPLKEEQKSVTDEALEQVFEDYGNLLWNRIDELGQDADDRPIEVIRKEYADRVRSLFGEKGKEGNK